MRIASMKSTRGRKAISLLLSVVMVLAAMPLTALPVFAVTSGDFEYSILSETDKTCEITDYTGSATALEIPSELYGYTVTSIGWDAFEYCTALTSITIPDSVTSIGRYAFYSCTALESITIPDSVTSIDKDAFYNTAYYNDSTHWENDVLYIGNHLIEAKDTLSGAYTVRAGTKTLAAWAFDYCTALTSVTIPDSVTSIGEYAFYYCKSLNSVTIPDSVTSIGGWAFNGCESLTSITIPDGVTSIGLAAFSGCTALTEIKVDTGNPNYTSESGVFFNRNKTALICYPAGKQDSSYIVPDSVTSIENYAFYDCSALTSITIPDSVTSIGDSAFAWCTALESITIPNSVTSIGDGAFSDCTALTSITIPDSVTSIGHGAFSGCTALESITIPDSVTRIGDRAFYSTAYYYDATHWENDVLYIGNHLIEAKDTLSGAYTVRAGTKTIANDAFYNCTSLTGITIPNSVTSIGEWAFDGCTSLASVTIPDSVTSIGEWAFSNCTTLTSITIPDSVTSIGDYAFQNCVALTSIVIPESVTSIGDSAFCGRTALTEIKVDTGNPNYTSESGVLFNQNKTALICYPAGKQDSSYIVPNSVTSIGDWAFAWCTALEIITIPNSVTSIGRDAFEYCTALTSITIPDSVTSIGDWAFERCTALTSIVIPESVTSISGSAFSNTGIGTVYGYTGSYAENYANIYGYTFVALNARGDVNGDGSPNSADYAMIKAYAIGNESLDLRQKYVSDLNRDGAVDAYDAIYLDLYLNGYLDTL